MNINKAIIIGRITRDPELKALPSGMSVCSFSVATNEVFVKDGEKKETTDYHNIVAFGKTGENISKYMKKGNEIYIEGKIQTRSWEDKNGVKQYRTEILANNVQFGAKSGTEAKNEPNKTGYEAIEEDQIEYPEDEINPSDIPF